MVAIRAELERQGFNTMGVTDEQLSHAILGNWFGILRHLQGSYSKLGRAADATAEAMRALGEKLR